MKSVFVCAVVLALANYAFAGVCNSDLDYNSTLTTPCLSNDIAVLWPNYADFSTYYKCVQFGKSELMKCPENTFFSYYYQLCTGCNKFIPAPPCEYLASSTDVTCVTTTPKPTTPKPTTPQPTTPKPTTPKPTTPTPTKTTPSKTTPTPSPITPPTAAPPTGLPTPPTDSSVTPSSGVPTPPLAVTPIPGIPTPPGMNMTPPNMGTPPTLKEPPSDS